MDFGFTDTQEVLDGLVRSILRDRATHERLKELEAAGGAVFDGELWGELAESGVTAIPVPERHGGSGLGLLDLLPVLEATGEHVAPVPVLETLVLVAPSLAASASDEMQTRWLPRIADGTIIATAAVDGGDPGVEVSLPAVTATRDGDHWSLSGEAAAVPYGAEADLVLVAATTDEGPGLFVAPREAVTSTTELLTTNRKPHADLRFDRSPAQALVDPGDAARVAIHAIRLRGAAAACAIQAGVCEGALAMLAEHTSNREQFGKPIAEFQAVAQRAADAFIDTQMVTLTARQAVYQLAVDGPMAAEVAVHTAKFWAGDGGMRVVHAAQHLHGGLGVDLDHPLHRYFLWAKQHEHTYGTPTRELIRLGAIVADEPV